MKILHIIPTLQKGGAERLCLDICNVLELKENHVVQLIHFTETNSYTFLTKQLDCKVISSQFIPSLKGTHRVKLDALQEAMTRFNPEIIHVHLFEALIAISQLQHSAHVIVHFHDNMVQFENFSWKTMLNKRRLTNFFEKRLVLKGLKNHKVTALGISSDTERYMKRVLPSHWRQVKLLNGINTQRFSQKHSWAEDELKDKQSTINLTTIGSLVEKKGQDLAIHTIAELNKRGAEVDLYVLGDGPKRQELAQLSKTLKIAESIHFQGNVADPENYLRRSTIYLHTAKYEPLGLVILEAMAAGLPVVCTDGRGNRDLIREGKNGFLVDSRNAKQLADKIEVLLENNQQRKEMGLCAQSFAKDYDIRTYVDRLLVIYTS